MRVRIPILKDFRGTFTLNGSELVDKADLLESEVVAQGVVIVFQLITNLKQGMILFVNRIIGIIIFLICYNVDAEESVFNFRIARLLDI